MLVIAHRGASGEFAENSLLAFQQAILQGCDGIEFDVQFHQASGEFILLHDSYLYNGAAKVHFNQLPLAELISARYNICTLNQALKCINTQCLINMELKSVAQGTQLANEMQMLIALLRNAELNNEITYSQIIISSFNHHALTYAVEHLPKITTAALIACCPIDYAKFCIKLKVKLLNLTIDCLNTEIVNDAHRRGLKVWVYTVDNPEQIKQCLQYQVDGIFSNFPHRSRQVISSVNEYQQNPE
ncbi:glycerophosphodiester phosphodiesterase [Colwellia sp. M166]|uniref:glycerophosphodiester phosphodiesterase n=1 Tax=Colwellia sp. M166 TaxID=2583805 RepID=UPI00211DBA3D|nr:glycerophosphodiester phosphodiesterase [Colwellia sp. M166]UUO23402.1 glycerophosphodiester phosphodiesterase [Colwellia sp. M166]|tara:strand:- start:69 stop:800 length:732 start_codon:yes stop_codon:yes gene_type:complete